MKEFFSKALDFLLKEARTADSDSALKSESNSHGLGKTCASCFMGSKILEEFAVRHQSDGYIQKVISIIRDKFTNSNILLDSRANALKNYMELSPDKVRLQEICKAKAKMWFSESIEKLSTDLALLNSFSNELGDPKDYISIYSNDKTDNWFHILTTSSAEWTIDSKDATLKGLTLVYTPSCHICEEQWRYTLVSFIMNPYRENKIVIIWDKKTLNNAWFQLLQDKLYTGILESIQENEEGIMLTFGTIQDYSSNNFVEWFISRNENGCQISFEDKTQARKKAFNSLYCFSLRPSDYAQFSDSKNSQIECNIYSKNQLPKFGALNGGLVYSYSEKDGINIPNEIKWNSRYPRSYKNWIEAGKEISKQEDAISITFNGLSKKDTKTYIEIIHNAIRQIPDIKKQNLDFLAYWIQRIPDLFQNDVITVEAARNLLQKYIVKKPEITWETYWEQEKIAAKKDLILRVSELNKIEGALEDAKGLLKNKRDAKGRIIHYKLKDDPIMYLYITAIEDEENRNKYPKNKYHYKDL